MNDPTYSLSKNSSNIKRSISSKSPGKEPKLLRTPDVYEIITTE